MKAGSKPGVRTIGVMPTRSAARTISDTSCRSKAVCSMSMKAASNPASPMISTICGSAMPPVWVPRASPSSARMRFTRFSCMRSSRVLSLSRTVGDGTHSARVLADERFHPLDCGPCEGRVGLAGHEAVISALVELQFDLAARLFPAGYKPLHGFERYPFVLVAAEDQRRRQMCFLAAVEDRRGAALAHRRLAAPEIVVVLDQLGIAGLLGEGIAQQRVEHAPARDHEAAPGIDLRRIG